MKDAKFLLKYGNVGYHTYMLLRSLGEGWQNRGGDRRAISRKYKKVFGCLPDLDNPRTMNEKIQWLKLNHREDVQTVMADKYAVRDWLVQYFGDEAKGHLIPLLYVTSDWHDITLDNLPDEPFIVKSNHGSHMYQIVYDKKDLDIDFLRQKCRMWLNVDAYKWGQEWQYKNIPRKIVVERLLRTSEGHIPNDYKLNYFNGRLEFVYCSIGRETTNNRNMYDADWNPLYFQWNNRSTHQNARGKEIEPPPSFGLMRRYGDEIAKMFDHVRCDFYDVDGKMYFGEVTFHHGGGYNRFVPDEYDTVWGDKLVLHKNGQAQ